MSAAATLSATVSSERLCRAVYHKHRDAAHRAHVEASSLQRKAQAAWDLSQRHAIAAVQARQAADVYIGHRHNIVANMIPVRVYED